MKFYDFVGYRNHKHNDINPTVHAKTQAETGGLCCSGTNGFINFLTLVLRYEERVTILTKLTTPNGGV